MTTIIGIALAGLSTAHAQEGGFDSQRYTPALDSRYFFQLTDTQVGPTWSAGGGATFNVASQPVVIRYEGDPLFEEEMPLLETVGTLNAMGWLNLPRTRVGVDVPLHLVTTGPGTLDEYRPVGDIRFVAAGELIERRGDGFGLGVQGQISAPTGSSEAWLGEEQVTAGGGLMGTIEAGPALLTANLGARSGTGARLDDGFRAGARMDYGVGIAAAAAPQVVLSAEVLGSHFLDQDHPYTTPVEALGGVRLRPGRSLTVSLGGGVGLSRGVGTPEWRALSGISWSPGDDRGNLLQQDLDGDGLSDATDRCPEQAEDYNGVEDGDGCPEGMMTVTTLTVVDAAGRQISGAELIWMSGPEVGAYQLTQGAMTRSMVPGSYEARVTAPGFRTESMAVTVPDASSHEQLVRLQPVAARGELRVTVHDIEGQPVEGQLRLVSEDESIVLPVAADGVASDVLNAGAYTAYVSSNGLRTEERGIEIHPGGETVVELILEAGRVTVEDNQMVLSDKIFFEFDSARIDPQSYSLLDEVSTTLKANPDIAEVTIEGHTDSHGPDDYNRRLSRDRAEAVRQYLVNSGIEESRLLAVGEGESEPLVDAEEPGEFALNRRVEFHITQRQAQN